MYKVLTISSPIKSIEEINMIKDFYKKKNQVRELLMFLLAINTGIDLVDLLNLKVKDVKNRSYLVLGKQRSIPLTPEVLELIPELVEGQPMSAYLFRNARGGKFNRTTVFYNFKDICTELGLSEKYSVGSWRKTFAYHYYQKYKDISYLMWLFNQHTVNIAFSFIGVEENMNLRFREGVCL